MHRVNDVNFGKLQDVTRRLNVIKSAPRMENMDLEVIRTGHV